MIVAVLALGLSACGDDDGSSTAADPASESTSESPSQTPTPTDAPTSPEESQSSTKEPGANWPACAEVWQAGATFPRTYQGCRQGDNPVPADAETCSFGTPLVTFDDRFYAVAGGPVNATQGPLRGDPDYQSARTSCTA